MATQGNMEAPRMKPSTMNVKRKFSRASACAANTPKSRPMDVVQMPMTTLLNSDRPKWIPRTVEERGGDHPVERDQAPSPGAGGHSRSPGPARR